MRRRCFVRLFAAAAVTAALESSWAAAGERSAPASARFLHVCDGPPAMARDERAALLQALREDGYVQEKNLELATFDFEAYAAAERSAPGPLFSLGKETTTPYAAFLAREIERTRPQLILASGVRAVQGAKVATTSVQVVFWRVTDPVRFGFVDSLARPGHNLTGFSRAIEKLTVKRLELLHEMVPGARRIAFLFIADYEHHVQQADDVRTAASAQRIEVVPYALVSKEWSPERLEQVFASMRQDRMEAFLLPDLNVLGEQIVALAAQYRLPTIHALAHPVTEWGGLAAYTTSDAGELAGVAKYAVRILKGEAARDLPVQEPSRYELILNERAARAIGVTFPPAFLLRATQVIR